MKNIKTKQKKRATTNYTNNTNKNKEDYAFYKETVINSFVKFVLFVVKKRGIGGKTIKNSVFFVVKYSGVVLCELCDFYPF